MTQSEEVHRKLVLVGGRRRAVQVALVVCGSAAGRKSYAVVGAYDSCCTWNPVKKHKNMHHKRHSSLVQNRDALIVIFWADTFV